MLTTVGLILAFAFQQAEPPISLSEASEIVWDGPFNTNAFFPEWSGEPDLTARYMGDEYGWPVWALAARIACPTQNGLEHPNACPAEDRDWIIRQAAAPQLEGNQRPRYNGSSFAGRVREGLQANSDVNTVAREAGLIWREARLSGCPVAQEAFDAFRNVSWIPTDHPLVDTRDELTLPLHADTIELTLQTYLQETRFTGWLAEGNPANRFNAFVVALQSCWTTPAVPAPWADTDAD